MEQNLQNTIASAMGMQSAETGVETPTEQPVTDEQTGENTVTPSAEQTQTQVQTEPDKTVNNNSTEHKEDSSTIKSMREQLANQKAEYKKLEEKLSKITDYLGKSADEVLADAQAKIDKTKADSLGVSPEVAKTIREQEQRIRELEEASIRDDFNYRANKFMNEFKLNEAQTTEFFNQAISKGFDLMKKGVDLGTIYRAINFDRLSKEKEAQIRQDILNEMQQQRESANGINTVSGTPAQTNTSSNGDDKDFVNAIYNQFSKK